MALTYQRAKEVAANAKALATQIKRLHRDAKALLATNSHLQLDWGAQDTPDYITEDEDGNLTDFRFSRTQISNVLGSLDQFVNLMDNKAATQGDHLGNINQVADVNPS